MMVVATLGVIFSRDSDENCLGMTTAAYFEEMCDKYRICDK
jgi:hypothetical protein